MKVAYSYVWKIALLAVVATMIPVSAFAQQDMDQDMNMDMNAPAMQQDQTQSQEFTMPSQPAMVGTGGFPTGIASNVDTSAFLYTGDIMTCTPSKVTGNIQMSVIDGTENDLAESRDAANVVASFTGTDGAKYDIKFTCISSVGTGMTHFGGVGLNKQVFGTTNVGGALGLPQTTAYIIAFGNVSITKDGQTLADGQPAIALVTDALHDANGAWLRTSDPSRKEIHLLVPGSLMSGGTALAGFPSGYFYIYWPSATYQLNSGQVNLSTTTQPVGRGPIAIQPMTLSITDSGIDLPAGTLTSGPYNVTITNNSSRTRGLVMTGTDICCSPFVRFNRVLAPGQSVTFRWFFAPGNVRIRDYTCAAHVARSLTNVTYGNINSTVTFQ